MSYIVLSGIEPRPSAHKSNHFTTYFFGLQASKMAMYTKYQRVCDTLFVFFTLSWLVTRLGFFPFWIINNTLFGAALIVPMFPAYYIFNSLLIILLVLHLFWTYLILRVAYKSILVGKVSKWSFSLVWDNGLHIAITLGLLDHHHNQISNSWHYFHNTRSPFHPHLKPKIFSSKTEIIIYFPIVCIVQLQISPLSMNCFRFCSIVKGNSCGNKQCVIPDNWIAYKTVSDSCEYYFPSLKDFPLLTSTCCVLFYKNTKYLNFQVHL